MATVYDNGTITWPKLINIGARKDIREWQISFDGTALVTVSGQRGTPNPRTARRPVKLNRSGRGILEQAKQDGDRKWDVKKHKGYYEESTGGASSDLFLPMLAEKLIDAAKGKDNRPKLRYPVTVEAKLDGIRMVAFAGSNGYLKATSRNGHDYQQLTAIKQEAAQLLGLLPPGTVLDGELYKHGWSRMTIASVVKQTDTPHPDEDQLEYHLFDLCFDQCQPGFAPVPTEERVRCLTAAVSALAPTHLKLVQKYQANNVAEIDGCMNYLVSQGYEGAIIRWLMAACQGTKDEERTYYRKNKSQNLFKYKYFDDEEGTIVFVVEGEGEHAGLAVFHVTDPRGNALGVTPRASHELRRKWFLEKDRLIGKKLTYLYKGLSPYGVPQHPVGIDIRDYE